MSKRFNVFDFETTDTDPKSCGVTQATVLAWHSEAVPTKLFNEMMLPSKEISEEASDVHGWTLEKLQEAGAMPEQEVMDTFVTTVYEERVNIFCGYNSDRFDNTILRRFFDDKYGHGQFDVRISTFDLMNWLLRHKELKSYKLGEAYQHFFGDYDEQKAHEATYDCYMVGRLVSELVPDLYVATQEMKEPAVISVMPFGKHSGKPFYKMPRRYMRYMLGLDINADVRLSMETELAKRPGRK